MLPRLHYFSKDEAGAPTTLGWAFGEGCEEKAIGALKRMEHPEMGTLVDRLERIAETETAYCHEYSLIGPEGFPLVTAGWHGCFQCFKNSEDENSTIVQYACTWNGDSEEIAAMAAAAMPGGVKGALAGLLD